MVKEKSDIGLFVAILEVCHITINYFYFLGKRVVQQIKHHSYHAKLINMKLNNQENSLKPFVMLYGSPRIHYFSSNSKTPRIGPFWAISDYRKCQNGWS